MYEFTRIFMEEELDHTRFDVPKFVKATEFVQKLSKPFVLVFILLRVMDKNFKPNRDFSQKNHLCHRIWFSANGIICSLEAFYSKIFVKG